MIQLSTETRSRKAYYVEARSERPRALDDGTLIGPVWRRVSFSLAAPGIGIPTGAFSASDAAFFSYHAAEALRHWLLADPTHAEICTRLVEVRVEQTTVVTAIDSAEERSDG